MDIKRLLILSTFLIIGMFILGFIIPKETKPSDSTRIILEHHKKTYIAPTCFEASDPSNFIEDSTLGRAHELNYKAHSTCTEDALESEQHSFIIGLLKDIGILSKKWDSW